MEIYLKGKYKKGGVEILNKDLLHSFFEKHKGEYFELIIRPHKKMMSAAQMRWYRGIAINVIIEGIKEQSGEIWSEDDIHSYNISKIMRPRITTKEILGETIVETKEFSMKNMTKPEFEWFKNELQSFWAGRAIDIPDPKEENYLNDEDGTGIRSIFGLVKGSTSKD